MMIDFAFATFPVNVLTVAWFFVFGVTIHPPSQCDVSSARRVADMFFQRRVEKSGDGAGKIYLLNKQT